MGRTPTNLEVSHETPVNADKTWTEDEARALSEAFDTAERPSRALSGRELVQTRLLPGIKKKLRAGWTYDEICQTLEGLGIAIAKSTLQGYVSRSRKPTGATKKASYKTPVTSDRAEAQSTSQACPDQQVSRLRSDTPGDKPSTARSEPGRSPPTVFNEDV